MPARLHRQDLRARRERVRQQSVYERSGVRERHSIVHVHVPAGLFRCELRDQH